MIIVSVKLLSAVDGSCKELARMTICNNGKPTTTKKHNYIAKTLRGRSTTALDKFITQRKTKIKNHPRDSVHIWNLVAKALTKMGYGE